MATTLPTITMPAGLPGWVLPGFTQQAKPTYGRVPMMTGHSRTRRIATGQLATAEAQLRLTADQLPIWHEFFETTLQGGVVPFAAQLPHPGGLRWFETLVLGYKSAPQNNGTTLLTASLLKRGAPSLTGPAA